MVIISKKIEDELEPNFEVVDNILSDKQVESFVKCENKRKKFNLN